MQIVLDTFPDLSPMASLSPEKADCLLQVVLDTLEYGSKIKKTPVVVGNCTGKAFCVFRGGPPQCCQHCAEGHQHAVRSWGLLSQNSASHLPAFSRARKGEHSGPPHLQGCM